MFDDVKSSKSKNDLSKNFTFSKSPKESVAGIAISAIRIKIRTLAFSLDILNLSINVAVGTSKILIPEVKAATNNNTKNAAETTFPKGICENIFGKVTKTSPAPEFGSRPNEKTAGKIIIPAKSANAVSENIIVYADFVIFLSSSI